MKRENSTLFLLILLGMLTAFGPFVTDMYLPTFPSMAAYFHTNSSMIQLGLTSSMIGLAIGQLFFGPLSDRYGRRPPLLIAMILFIVSTVFCIFSRSIHEFVILRFVQGVAGSGGIVIARSIATDLYSDRELARMMALIGAINGVAPVVAPVVGGMLTDSVGWQGIFVVLLLIGLVLLAGCIRFRESLTTPSKTGWNATFSALTALLRNRNYICYVLQFGFAQGLLFAYIASSPFIVQEHYGFSPLGFSLCFGVNAVGIGVGAFLSARFRRPERAMSTGSTAMTILALVLCGAMWSGCGFWLYESLLLLLLFATGMVFASVTTLSMESGRAHAGMASALLGAVGFAFGGLVSPLVGIGNWLQTAGSIFAICALCSLLSGRMALKEQLHKRGLFHI